MNSYEIQKFEKIYENQGYIIALNEMYAQSAKDDPNGCKHYICLGYDPDSKMWVTWESTDMEYYFWGHYFDDHKHALADYHLRLAEHYKDLVF